MPIPQIREPITPDWVALMGRNGKAPRGSAIRELLAITANRSVIGFGGGLTAPELFPAAELAECLGRVLADRPASALQYGPTEGLAALREAVAVRLSERGIEVPADGVLITTGSQQGLDLLAEAFLTKASPVVIEAPTYVGALQALSAHEPAFTSFSIDEEGLEVDALEDWVRANGRPDLIYTVPTFGNPSGMTMSRRRRERLLELAARFAVPLLEDDPYSELVYDGMPPVAMRAMPGGEDVIHVGTFSKVLAPGIRIGYVVAPRAVLERLILMKQGRDLHTDALAQNMVAEYCTRFGLEPHIERLRAAYRQRRDAMLAALRRTMPASVTWTQPSGGMFLWLTLPAGLVTSDLLRTAVAAGVSFVPGTAFHADGSGVNSMRLNFTSSSLEEIARGVGILGRLVSDQI
jgi:2-aminoadipate transaminase